LYQRGKVLRIEIVHAREHMPGHYQDYIDGQRALQLLDEQRHIRGELVWRVATGHTVEITEFGILNPKDRRQGWGSKLLQTALEDMRHYFDKICKPLTRVYLFCEAKNVGARAFYEAHGFHLDALLKDFYPDGNAALYSLSVE
jgi:ribosomal protein S18 acetylase RimI-like enzyme